MNLFVLDADPDVAARYHCDKHVVKMVLETAQLLSTAHRLLDSEPHALLYKATHANHPCAKWVRASKGNYRWAYLLFSALCKEYTNRYHRVHACQRLKFIFVNYPDSLPNDNSLHPFAMCMPEQYQTGDAVQAYRNYYMSEKAHFAHWPSELVPYWWHVREAA